VEQRVKISFEELNCGIRSCQLPLCTTTRTYSKEVIVLQYVRSVKPTTIVGSDKEVRYILSLLTSSFRQKLMLAANNSGLSECTKWGPPFCELFFRLYFYYTI